MALSEQVRAYVPLRKKRKSAHAGEEEDEETSNGVSPYHTLAAADVAPALDSDALQEAAWTRLEHGISVATDAASNTSSAPTPTAASSSAASNTDVPLAVETFEQMNLPTPILRALHDRGVVRPSAIQMQAIPTVLSGRDVIGLAATGSGKTLCYLVPLLVLLSYQQQQLRHSIATTAAAAPVGLVVVPTRELMEQIVHELRYFSPPAPPPTDSEQEHHQWLVHGDTFTALGVCGGIALQHHVALIQQSLHHSRSDRAPVNVIVATPGRLLHLLERRAVTLDALQYLVLDEVDRMLDIEMEPQLRAILHAANGAVARQTLLWSATMPHFLDRLARSAVLDPITICVGMGRDRVGRTRLDVSQDVQFVESARHKRIALLQALRSTAAPPVLVFCNSHASVDAVTRVLQTEQFHVASLHGDKSQAYRFQVMAAFRAGYVDVLVATDVAARGLDFRDVAHVIIYDMPHTIDDYIHRCGRTGRRQPEQSLDRASRTQGRVTALLMTECSIAKELRALLVETKQPVPRELEAPSRFQAPPPPLLRTNDAGVKRPTTR